MVCRFTFYWVSFVYRVILDFILNCIRGLTKRVGKGQHTISIVFE